MKVNRLFFFLILFNFTCLLSHAQSPAADSIQFVKALNQAKAYLSDKQYQEAKAALSKAKKLQPGSMISQFNYLQLEQQLYYRSGEMKTAKIKAQELLGLGQKLKYKSGIAEAYYAISLCQRNERNLNAAIESLVKALKSSETLKDNAQKQKIYSALSDIFFELRETKKMLFYADKADAYGKLANDTMPLMLKLLNDAINHLISKEPDITIQKSTQALQLAQENKKTFQVVIAYLYLRHAYQQKKDYVKALSYLRLITPLLNGLKERAIINVHVELAYAETYYYLGNYALAESYFRSNIKIAEKEMDIADVKEMYDLGSKIYEKLGNLRTALTYIKQYKAFTDSIGKITTEKSIHETEIKYQTTLKEKAISEQKLQLLNKDNELHKKNRYLLIGLFVIILLISSAIITSLINRNKTQAVELSLLKAQIHPHFLFNTLNNLYALTRNKSEEAPGVVLGISTILRYILYECNTLRADLSKELNMISHYISLEKIRFKNRLEVNFNIEGDVSDRKIAPLLILPLVENAFKHGAAKLLDEAWINIEAIVEDDRFTFKISNNKPSSAEIITNESKYGNIGLLNIKKRLSILYPKRHKLKVMEEDDVFIVVLELFKF